MSFISFDFAQTLRYVFNGYFLLYSILMSTYGLIVDIGKNKEVDQRDKKVAKFLYISCIVVATILFTVPLFL